MDSLVLDLQQLASDEQASVTNLLRKALLTARKLELEEFATWVDNELNGYGPDDDVPSYRIVEGEPRAQTISGLKPIVFEGEEINEMLSQFPIRNPIGEVENLANEDSEYLTISYPAELSQTLSRIHGSDVHPRLFCSHASFASIVEAVKSSVLEWALDLESDGIMGEGMTFSGEEKHKAEQSNYHVHIEEMINSQIQQGTYSSSQEMSVSYENTLDEIKDFLSKLRHVIEDENVDEPERSDLEAEITIAEAQLSSSNPNPGILKETLNSIRSIIEGVGGNLLSSGIVEHVPALVSQLDSI
jgi:hypothetical protein